MSRIYDVKVENLHCNQQHIAPNVCEHLTCGPAAMPHLCVFSISRAACARGAGAARTIKKHQYRAQTAAKAARAELFTRGFGRRPGRASPQGEAQQVFVCYATWRAYQLLQKRTLTPIYAVLPRTDYQPCLRRRPPRAVLRVALRWAASAEGRMTGAYI